MVAAFPLPSRIPSWFAGHMASSLRKLPAVLQDIDMVIEVRDARLPLTSVNPAFEQALSRAWGYQNANRGFDRKGKGRDFGVGKEKVVVYTKRDLAEKRYEEPLRRAFLEHAGTKLFFADTRIDRDVSPILDHAVRLAKNRIDDLEDGLNVMVVGMPNVGKSSLLNALRRVGVHKGKAFATSSLPGLTRKLTGTVKIHKNPTVYVYDTPGVMVPYLGKGEQGAERGLKLALTAGIKEGLFEPDIVAEYLLWTLNARIGAEAGMAECDPKRHMPYTDLLPLPADFEPTTDLQALLGALATRLGLLRKGGEKDLDVAREWLIKAFREGKVGRWTLDDLEAADGVSGTAALEQSQQHVDDVRSDVPPDSGPTTEVAPTTAVGLSAKVSAAVEGFLAQQSSILRASEEGRDMSLTQRKKRDNKAKSEEREAKWRAKGIPVGMDRRTARSRGPGRPPFARPRTKRR